ncbi:MAG: hypothetical protein EBZ48_06845 [Proteobacteria bacterium]|nr:hypothetical protein [Pseudomonadota bacterium]
MAQRDPTPQKRSPEQRFLEDLSKLDLPTGVLHATDRHYSPEKQLRVSTESTQSLAALLQGFFERHSNLEKLTPSSAQRLSEVIERRCTIINREVRKTLLHAVSGEILVTSPEVRISLSALSQDCSTIAKLIRSCSTRALTELARLSELQGALPQGPTAHRAQGHPALSLKQIVADLKELSHKEPTLRILFELNRHAETPRSCHRFIDGILHGQSLSGPQVLMRHCGENLAAKLSQMILYMAEHASDGARLNNPFAIRAVKTLNQDRTLVVEVGIAKLLADTSLSDQKRHSALQGLAGSLSGQNGPRLPAADGGLGIHELLHRGEVSGHIFSAALCREVDVWIQKTHRDLLDHLSSKKP